jgi:methyl-accepting chemotaxis protein
MTVAKSEYGASKTRYSIGVWLNWIVVLISLSVAVVATRYLARTLKERFSYLNSRLSSIAGGNYITDVKIGEDELQDTLISVQALQAKLAYGEIQKKEATQEKIAMQVELADRFEREVSALITDIGTSASQLQLTAQSMAETAEQTSVQSSMVAAASEQATANVQNVSAATEELSSSISEIQRRVSQSTENVTTAVQQANEANKKVSRLTDAAQKIGAVVDMIHKIAGQTNLLALNATIEAARAGEAGKGFAVVASEVKSLAGQTAKATEEISQQVARIQEETQQSVGAIQQVSSVINDVNSTTAAISAAVSEQGSATQEIARNITEAAVGTQEVSSSIARVHQAAQNTGAAAGKVLDAASGLAKNSGILKNQVREFLNSVRNS